MQAEAQSTGSTDLIAAAQQRFAALGSYRVTIRSTTGSNGALQVVRFYYRAPGLVRMEFVTPHAGAVLVYRPGTGKVRLWPFGLGNLPVLTLAPDNPLIRGAHEHRVDRSDAGALLANLLALADGGSIAVADDERIGRWKAKPLVVTGAPGRTVSGVHRYQVWLAEESLFPVKVASYDLRGNRLECVLMDDVVLGEPFPDEFFNP
ncbi:DUF1571 domain-containing protein [Crenobacter sp. SG2303]|uniref:DUF1571 domain-containing protein n=1 Tax=Crenobacter oryzisoli TaxID=3056844 RepID=A0ABT7XN89_9NEIS|nr:DUF1571 domain-containing protein [Crenobacter sp. SG2303]MDN0075143.1 DUF1571 domain-containing protein [Crenobacter sp. SG2303]